MQSLGNYWGGMSAFIEAGKKTRAWHLKNGFIHTNFGWLHRSWIDQGFRMGAISATTCDGVYSVCPDVSTEYVSKREGRSVMETKKEKLDFSKYKNWMKFVETKREVTKLPVEITAEVMGAVNGRQKLI